MTDEKSQVAVNLTAEDITKYFSNNHDNDNSLIDFLEDFNSRGFTVNDFKFRIISKESREYKIMLLDNKGVEHECKVIDTFLDNLEEILNNMDPMCRFWDLVDEEFVEEMEFYKNCTLEKLKDHIKDDDIFAFLGPISVIPYGAYFPITHLLENPNQDVIQWVIDTDPVFHIEFFWECNEEYDFDDELSDTSICGFINRNQKNPELREMLLEHYKGQ